VIKLKDIFENKIMSESMIDDFVKNNVAVKIGSGTDRLSHPTKEFYMDGIEAMIYHYFIDRDFYANYLDKDQKREYKESVKKLLVNPFKSNPDSFIKKYIETSEDIYSRGDVIKMKDKIDYEKIRISIIKKQSKSIQDAWKECERQRQWK